MFFLPAVKLVPHQQQVLKLEPFLQYKPTKVLTPLNSDHMAEPNWS